LAEAIDYMTNNQDDLGGVTQRVYDIESSAKAYRDQANVYKQLSLNQNALPGTQRALRAAGTLDNPQSITETFASIPGSGVSYDAQSNSYTFENPKYEPIGLTIDNAINKGGAAYFEGTGEDNRHFSGNVMINNNTIIWQYPVDAPIAVNVAYQAKKVDEDGFILIYDYMVEAVMWYICWNFYLRYPKQYTPDQGAIWKREWKAQHDRVVSFDAFQSFQNNFAKAVSLSHPRVLSL